MDGFPAEEIIDAARAQSEAMRLHARLVASGVPAESTLVFVMTLLGGKRPGIAQPLVRLMVAEVDEHLGERA